MYSAEFGPALDTRDTMTAIADLRNEGEGSVALAADTGGFSIRGSNDFKTGAARIGEESQAFYLLGYDPGEVPKDGKFRKIEVKVRGRYTVRARRGYYARGLRSHCRATRARVAPIRFFRRPSMHHRSPARSPCV